MDYVGVGRITTSAVKVSDFMVTRAGGSQSPLMAADVSASEMFTDAADDTMAEYLLRIELGKTVAVKDAMRETGFFGNQHSICAPQTAGWVLAVERLRQRFGIKKGPL